MRHGPQACGSSRASGANTLSRTTTNSKSFGGTSAALPPSPCPPPARRRAPCSRRAHRPGSWEPRRSGRLIVAAPDARGGDSAARDANDGAHTTAVGDRRRGETPQPRRNQRLCRQVNQAAAKESFEVSASTQANQKAPLWGGAHRPKRAAQWRTTTAVAPRRVARSRRQISPLAAP